LCDEFSERDAHVGLVEYAFDELREEHRHRRQQSGINPNCCKWVTF
jgi:hypothetical protein